MSTRRGSLCPHVSLHPPPAGLGVKSGRPQALRESGILVRWEIHDDLRSNPIVTPSASIFVVGCLTGSLVGGYQCEHLGRRKSMMLDSVLMLAGFVCVAIAPNVEVFLLGKIRVFVCDSLIHFFQCLQGDF